MLNIKLEENSYKISFKVLPVKIQQYIVLSHYFAFYAFINSFNCIKQSYCGRNLLRLSKKCPRPNVKDFQYQIWTDNITIGKVKDRKSNYQVRQTLALFCKLVALILA